MVLDKMIKVEGVEPLFKVFTHLSSSTDKILLWQSMQENNYRLCQNARIGQLNLQGEEMTLYPIKGEFAFRGQSMIYFFGHKRSTIFKAPVLYHSPLKIVIRLPRLIMMANSRSEERKDLVSGEKLVHYTYHAQGAPSTGALYHHSRIIDASSQGLSFRSSVNNVLRFKKGDRLWMRSPFLDEKLLECEVRYVAMVKNLGEESFQRIGVKF